MNILIVEDDRTSARIIELTLKRYGYKYHLAENGHSALSQLSNSIEIQLVVSDIMMPDMDGLELLTKMKNLRELQKMPVIMCTTRADVETVKRAVKLGCNDYIIKPVNPLQLLKKIERILENETPILVHYRDLVLETRMDRHSYSELLKTFTRVLAGKIHQVEEKVTKLEVLTPGELDELTKSCKEVGASRLHQQLGESKNLLDQTSGEKEPVLAEMRLILREMKLLQFHLPN
ncbi:MAG: response regulator [bacterium]|nr:response regulator [bacterium]